VFELIEDRVNVFFRMENISVPILESTARQSLSRLADAMEGALREAAETRNAALSEAKTLTQSL